MTTVYLVRGRSIDGTCWLDGINSWTTAIGVAHRFKGKKEAELLKEAMWFINVRKDPDDMVGRLAVVEYDDSYLNKEMAEYYAMMEEYEDPPEE